MWKESYRIGQDSIDRQHMELFRVTGELLKTVNQTKSDDTKEVCKAAVAFLKDYAVEHFTDEEKYQEAIQYSGIEAHRKIHKKFVTSVLDYEKKMIESDFDWKVVKDFTGMLAAWLIYHVTDEDQKYAKGADSGEKDAEKSIFDILAQCTCQVLRSVVGLEKTGIKNVFEPESGVKGDIAFTMNLTGDMAGTAELVFTKEIAFKIFETMTTILPAEIDELVCSALSEISHIISDNVLFALSKNGVQCEISHYNLSVGEVGFNPEGSMALYTILGNLGIHILT